MATVKCLHLNKTPSLFPKEEVLIQADLSGFHSIPVVYCWRMGLGNQRGVLRQP
ncbi:MAG: hypothetical protein AAGA83_08645 [Cyanobacteria bacterium P01_F01_bin.116]